MLGQRNRRRRERPLACPRCNQTPSPPLVHIEGLTFLCDQCLHEIHAEPRRTGFRERAAAARGGVMVVAALLTLVSSTFLNVNE